MTLFIMRQGSAESVRSTACELHNVKEVFLVGHDLYSDDDKVNNIYGGWH